MTAHSVLFNERKTRSVVSQIGDVVDVTAITFFRADILLGLLKKK